jgi:hypothetical protein
MKIAIVGSRDWPNAKAVIDYVNALPSDTVIVSGGARGVDTFAEIAAKRRGLAFVCFPANWAKHGKFAGYHRNKAIVAAANKVTAFWDGCSKGTLHGIQLARKAGKPVEVHYPDGRVERYNETKQGTLL